MKENPNIILIMTDQQQARVCGREGFPLDVTPHQDKMAQEGAWFNKAYTSAPLCGPARVSMFTGRYATATGVRGNSITSARYSKDLIDVLKEKGYKTALIGKNHTHITEDKYDFWYEHGHQGAHFDHGEAGKDRTTEDIEFDSWLRSLHHWIHSEPTPFSVECQSPHRLVNAAHKWVKKIKYDSPFFIHLSISEPHNPYQVPEPYFSLFRDSKLPPIYGNKNSYREKGFKYKFVGELERKSREDFDEKFDDYRYNYYAMCRLIDDQLNRLENLLSEEGVLENTVIFFVSDHGDFVGDYGLMRKGPGLPESLCRIPFFVKGPGIKSESKASDAHVNLVDIMPTICEMIDVKIPEGVQGKSLVPLLRGEDVHGREFDTAFVETGYGGLDYNEEDKPDFNKYISPNEISFNELNQYTLGGSMRMVRHKDWKLIVDNVGSTQLYNLNEDPAELNDLSDCSSVKAVQMKSLLLSKMTEKLIQNEDPLCNVTETSSPDKKKLHLRNYFYSK